MSHALDGHVTKVDRSPTTGTLVVCTCGAVVGPMSHEHALDEARDHRQRHHRRR